MISSKNLIIGYDRLVRMRRTCRLSGSRNIPAPIPSNMNKLRRDAAASCKPAFCRCDRISEGAL
eukprot:scaffold1895_cov222-Chaetoceros_neogracile.AAC.5